MFYSTDGNFIEKFNEIDIIDNQCYEMKSELQKLFEEYNQAKTLRNEVELNIENIKKQLLDAKKEKDLSISNINKVVRKYNKLLIDLHNFNCG